MIILPKPPIVVEKSDSKGVFVIENCYPGYGVTIANSLRRVILSSLPGGAVVAVKIKDALHEFSTLPYINENVVDIILNIKQLRFKIHTPPSQDSDTSVYEIALRKRGKGIATSSNIKVPSEVEVVNKNLPLATLTDEKAKLDIILYLGYGVGYEMSTEHKKGNDITNVGVIKVDSLFSPVIGVNYKVEDMRVSDRIDFNRIILTIETDGSVDPEKCLYDGIDILVNNFSALKKEDKKNKVKKEKPTEQKESKKKKDDNTANKAKKAKSKTLKNAGNNNDSAVNNTPIVELKLSPRIENVLIERGLNKIGDLLPYSEEDLKQFEGLGEKAVHDIRRKLGKFGVILKR